MKNIYCIRHGLALHNVLGQEIGSKAYFLEKCFDAPLVDKGILQAKELGKKWDNLDKIQKVFVSPLTRTLQTAENIFKDKFGLKIIALDGIKSFLKVWRLVIKEEKKKNLKVILKELIFQN